MNICEPNWLNLAEVLAAHDQIILIHGGASGVRDEKLLDSAINRPKNYWAYEGQDLFQAASFYAHGIANNHPFVDGNKRTAFVSTILFLETNDKNFHAPEEEVVEVMIGLANKSIPREEFANWLKLNSN